MSERMSDETLRERYNAGCDGDKDAHLEVYVEARRARASEAEKEAKIAAQDATIKALADALEGNGRTNPEFADSAWHTHDCWENRRASCSKACVATVAALRLAGRL